MAKIQLFLLSVLLAVLFAMIMSEPLPEGGNAGNKGSAASAEPEGKASEAVEAEPESEAIQKSSVSMNQAQILTSFASFIAYWLI